MTRTDNHNMIVRASEQTSWRSLYRYLNLAYMHPEKVNNILSGKEPCSVTEIFAIATKHQI